MRLGVPFALRDFLFPYPILMQKVIALLLISFLSPTPAQADIQPLTVMSRNLYLGADVGVALELIPDFSSAAQYM